jgi:hypothetical protein
VPLSDDRVGRARERVGVGDLGSHPHPDEARPLPTGEPRGVGGGMARRLWPVPIELADVQPQDDHLGGSRGCFDECVHVFRHGRSIARPVLAGDLNSPSGTPGSSAGGAGGRMGDTGWPMAWRRTSTIGDPPADPLGEAVARAVTDLVAGAAVELRYVPEGADVPAHPDTVGTAMATGGGPPGWQTTLMVRLDDRVARLVDAGQRNALAELLDALPQAGLAAAASLRSHDGDDGAMAAVPALRRAVRDMVAAQVLTRSLNSRLGTRVRPELLAETIEFLIELSGTRVESHDLTHGVIVTDVLSHPPRLLLRYPSDIRTAKRAPLLFDGQRSVLVVDPEGRARTELLRHRLDRLAPGATRAAAATDDDWVESGSLVARATSALGGLGFFVRADRSIWTFVDGQPLLVRRGEHWTAFPLELSAAIENMIGGGSVAALVARSAFMISTRPSRAILAIVGDPTDVEGVVSAKDRYDLRKDVDPTAMRAEARLHHLIDAEDLDEHTLVRLATLDGATVLDRDGRLIAYGAIVTSADSQFEGARTAAARTLSETALVVLRVSVDGGITIFRAGAAVTTLLGRAPEHTT